MVTWTIAYDGRVVERDDIIGELKSLVDTVSGLSVEWLEETFDDPGAFRNFVPLARLTHPQVRGLEIACEELLDDFGFGIDLQK